MKLIKVFSLLFILVLLTRCGPQGAQGPQGPAGISGGCTVLNIGVTNAAPNGGTMIGCTDGTSSLILNGAPGVPGTMVPPIQFCAGVTPIYPSNFPEVGFCINGNMYAVYSTNGGFMAEIPPGYYSSDGVNASCNFTVNVGCTVSN